MAFIKVRKEATGWRWVCRLCPPNAKNDQPRGGLHRFHRLRDRPSDGDALNRCMTAAHKHYRLRHDKS